MRKAVDWIGLGLSLLAAVRFVIIPLALRLLGSIALYIATKLGEQVAMDYIQKNVPLLKRKKA